MNTTAYITHNTCLLHLLHSEHPECPGRLHAINDQLLSQRLLEWLQQIDAPQASTAQLARVHTPAYIASLEHSAPAAGVTALDEDTWLDRHSLAAARHGAGAVIEAVDLVLDGTHANAFCAVRPPGHHATADRAQGFCLFNNVAVGAAHALARGAARVAIVDFDAHHGDGTEAIFSGQPDVLYCSSYQHPFYPFAEPTDAAENMVHCPLPAGADGAALLHAVRAQWLPALRAFRPQLLLISAGFDGHREDPLAQLRYDEASYRDVTTLLCDFAGQYCGGNIVSVLEGGYHLAALGRSAAAHIKVLMGLDD